MIFTEKTIKVTNGASQINSPIVLYKGDKNIKIRFKIVDCPYTYSKNVDNIIEVSEAAYAQLVIKTPNDELPIFSDIAETESGYVTFTITGEMIDGAEEVGKYSFQVRLLDSEQFSRITIPEVVDGIEVRDPIAIEGVSATNEVDIAMVNYAVATAATPEDAFDSQGNYNKTTWGTGDRITAAKLNKMEAGIDSINKKANNIPTRTSQLENDSDYATITQVNQAIDNAQLGGGASNINDTSASTTTTYSSNKIESIKEDLSSQIRDIVNKIGTETLSTTAQDLKGAINEVFQNVSNGKQLIATAITDKGVATSSNSTFQTMADNIKNISSANINVEGFTEYTLFETDEVIPDTWIGANGGRNLVLSSDDFLNTFYDNLITNNSDYGTITKTALGKDESQTYTIYEYDFKPNNWNRMILLSSGMHPYELPAPFGLAYFMKYVMTSNNVAMKYIRENVRIKVIPIINPWGWNQKPRKYGTVNGVNINRNFDPMGLWERYNGNTTEWNQKGTSAYSENETKILRNWLSRNKGAEFYIDCHTGYNAFATDVTNALYYLSDSPIKTQIESALTKLNNWITSKFGVTGKANSNRAQNPTGVFDYGVTDYAEKELGIPAFTIEQRPESTVFGTTAVNEGADIKHYMTSISTYVMELLLKQPEHIAQSTVIQMKQSIIELNKDEANYITLEGGTTPIEPTEPIEPIQLEKFDINLSNINSGDTSITDSTNNKTLDIVGTDWTKNDDGSITFGAKSSLRYDGGLCTENNKVFTVVLDMSAKLSTSGTKYAMLWGDFNSDTEGIFFMCDNKQFYFKDFSKGNGAQAVYAGALARDKYLLICNGSQIILRTKTKVLSAGSLNDLTIPAHNKVYFGNTNTLSKNMDCKLYEIKWYNKALSDEEIQAL